MNDVIKFHSERAMAELRLAGCAQDARAARAHLALSELHLEKMRELAGSPGPIQRPSSTRA